MNLAKTASTYEKSTHAPSPLHAHTNQTHAKQ